MSADPGSSARAQGFVPGAHAIDSYGSGGFRFAGMSHKGSIIALPSGIQSWPVENPAHIDVASLTAVLVEMHRIDLLLIGTGEHGLGQDAPFAVALREVGVKIDVMDTPAAARTYNLMFDEGRRVAAALIAVA